MDTKDQTEKTALMYAVLNSHAATAQELVNAGADARAADSEGRTPVSVATEHDDAMCMKALGLAEGVYKAPKERTLYREATATWSKREGRSRGSFVAR